MISDELKEALNRLEEKLDNHIARLEPIILEYHTSKMLKRKVTDWMKTTGMVIALALSGLTLKEKLTQPQVKEAKLKTEEP